MSKPSLPRHPSLESSASVGEPALRASLFDCKDDFIERVAPIGMAAIYFGGLILTAQDAALSRQALFKLSFLHRHFLQPAGLRISVQSQTAILFGSVKSSHVVTMADLLARQIDGIKVVRDETDPPKPAPTELENARAALQLLFATDQTLHTGLQVTLGDGQLILEGEAISPAQKNWAVQLAGSLTGRIDSRLTISSSSPAATTAPPDMDDESLQALALLRLRLVRETEHLPLRIKAARGIVTLQGRVRTEELRQRTENLVRSTLGLRELRSSLSVAG